MKKEIEEVLGSWDLEVGSFSYLITWKRDKPKDF